MTNPLASSAVKASTRAFQVRAPRISDAIGAALQDVYADEPALPEDMKAILRRLNRCDSTTEH